MICFIRPATFQSKQDKDEADCFVCKFSSKSTVISCKLSTRLSPSKKVILLIVIHIILSIVSKQNPHNAFHGIPTVVLKKHAPE